MRILVLGFYDRKNFGDDLFKYIFQHHLTNNRLIEYDCYNINDVDFEDVKYYRYNIIVVGGGDLFNDYFFNEDFCNFLQSTKAVKYAISVGLPYVSCVNYVDLFDYAILRTKADYELVRTRLGHNYVSYFPDMSYVLQKQIRFDLPVNVDVIAFRVGVFLANPLFHDNTCDLEEKIVNCLCRILDKFPQVQLVFIPMNTNTANNYECDYVIIDKVVTRLSSEYSSRLEYSQNFDNPQDYFKVLSTIDFSICMRFHSVMLSLLYKIPFMAVYTQRKIDNLLNDFNLQQQGYRIPVDPISLVPNGFDEQTFDGIFENLMANYFVELSESAVILPKETDFVDKLITVFRRPVYRRTGRKFVRYSDIEEKTTQVYNAAVAQLQNNLDPTLFGKFVIFDITGQASSQYLYGFVENSKKPDFNLYENIKWIVEDYNTHQKISSVMTETIGIRKIVKVNMSYMNQIDFVGVHRSGWNYVSQGLLVLDSPNGILLDTYVDRTFHWACDILSIKKIIPYKKPWVGFIHHTFLEDYSPYDCNNLFTNELFLESLTCCKTLFTLSKYLAKQIKQKLIEVGFANVGVETLVHPTEFPNTAKFSIEKFARNTNRRIVQIGGWMRNPWGIYELYTGASQLKLQKTVLVGKNMKNYVKPENFETKLIDFVESFNNEGSNAVCDVTVCDTSTAASLSNNKIDNIFLRHWYLETSKKLQNVDTIIELNNDEYDNLLSENIVFLNLYDASAVNTVIECIVRNTPVLVNRHESLQEILGNGYPLFYDNIDQAHVLINSMAHIFNAVEYLKRLDKQKLHLKYFINDFQSKLIQTLI